MRHKRRIQKRFGEGPGRTRSSSDYESDALRRLSYTRHKPNGRGNSPPRQLPRPFNFNHSWVVFSFTTTASDPYLADEKLFAHSPTVLHLSLRDICVNVILASQNIVDDVNHCLKANTSLHLAEMATGNRDFVSASLVDVLDQKLKLDHDRPRTFSAFWACLLDIAVDNLCLRR
jgi:hypothetical protein